MLEFNSFHQERLSNATSILSYNEASVSQLIQQFWFWPIGNLANKNSKLSEISSYIIKKLKEETGTVVFTFTPSSSFEYILHIASVSLCRDQH